MSATTWSFAGVLRLYNNPPGFSGSFLRIQFDLAKFLGHELFVCLMAPLIREERWEIVGDVLGRGLYVENPSDWRPRLMPFTTISQGLELLDHRNRRLNLRRISLHADLLNQRHSEGPIADLVAMTDFTAADLFLHLRAVAGAGPNSRGWDWRPWSLLYLNQAPKFLHNLMRTKEAEELLEPLGVRDVEHLRSLLAQRLPQLAAFYEQDGLWHNPLATFDSSVVGTR